jgi:hypothetical protein
MQPRLARLYCVCGLVVALAPGVRAQLSDKIRAEIAALLPKYDPKIHEAPPEARPPPPPLSDDPLFRLPDLVVRDTKLPDIDSDQWLSKKALQKKAIKEYRNSMNTFEWLLNGWSIPLIGTSLAARAKARYDADQFQEEISDLSRVITTGGSDVDSDYAKKTLRALDFSRHPGN